MTILTLPPELRVIIYDYCFPAPQSHVVLVPYRPAKPECHLDLPLSLYLVCKTIHNDLTPLQSKLHALNLVYIVRMYLRPEEGPRVDDVDILQAQHFTKMVKFATRIRVIGPGEDERLMAWGSMRKNLSPGPERNVCAVRTLEVQPTTVGAQNMWMLLMMGLKEFVRHPDVTGRLQLKLIRDGVGGKAQQDVDEDLDELEDILIRWQKLPTYARLFVQSRPSLMFDPNEGVTWV